MTLSVDRKRTELLPFSTVICTGTSLERFDPEPQACVPTFDTQRTSRQAPGHFATTWIHEGRRTMRRVSAVDGLDANPAIRAVPARSSRPLVSVENDKSIPVRVIRTGTCGDATGLLVLRIERAAATLVATLDAPLLASRLERCCRRLRTCTRLATCNRSNSRRCMKKRRRGLRRPGGAAPSPRQRTVADEATEHAGQVRLVVHPAGQRNIAHRILRRQQQPLCQLHSLAGDVGHRREAEAPFECTREMARAEAGERGEILDPDRRVQIRLDVRDGTTDLPIGQPAVEARGRAGFGNRVFMQEFECTRDAGSREFTIGSQCGLGFAQQNRDGGLLPIVGRLRELLGRIGWLEAWSHRICHGESCVDASGDVLGSLVTTYDLAPSVPTSSN